MTNLTVFKFTTYAYNDSLPHPPNIELLTDMLVKNNGLRVNIPCPLLYVSDATHPRPHRS